MSLVRAECFRVARAETKVVIVRGMGALAIRMVTELACTLVTRRAVCNVT